jgi:hypothetical protein
MESIARILYSTQQLPQADEMVDVYTKQDSLTLSGVELASRSQCHSDVSHRESWPADVDSTAQELHVEVPLVCRVLAIGFVATRKLYFLHISFRSVQEGPSTLCSLTVG